MTDNFDNSMVVTKSSGAVMTMMELDLVEKEALMTYQWSRELWTLITLILRSQESSRTVVRS